MGKFMTFSFILSGLVIWSFLAGVYGGSCSEGTECQNTSNTLLFSLLHPFDMNNGSLFQTIRNVIIGIGLAIVVGFFTKDFDKSVASGIFATILSFFWDVTYSMSAIFFTSTATYIIGILIFAPILIMYMFAFLEWWRLKD